MAKFHLHRRQIHLFKTRFRANDSNCRLKDDGLAAHGLELLRGFFMVARLAQWVARQIGHLVGANDHGGGVECCDRPRFGQCKPKGKLFGRLSVVRGFIDFGGGHIERQVQARQQFAPIAGGGAQYQRAWQGGGFMHAPILLHCRHDQGILPRPA